MKQEKAQSARILVKGRLLLKLSEVMDWAEAKKLLNDFEEEVLARPKK